MSTLHDDDSSRSLGSEMKDTTETLKASATDKLTSSSEKRLNTTGETPSIGRFKSIFSLQI